jgi:hypothetical protein
MPSSISRNLIHWFLNLSNNFQTHLFHLNDSFMMWFFQQIKNFNTTITIRKKCDFQTFLEAILWCFPYTFQLSQNPKTMKHMHIASINHTYLSSTQLQWNLPAWEMSFSFHPTFFARPKLTFSKPCLKDANHLNSWKIPENDNVIIEQMYLEKKETRKTQSNNLHKSSRWIRHISSSNISALTC